MRVRYITFLKVFRYNTDHNSLPTARFYVEPNYLLRNMSLILSKKTDKAGVYQMITGFVS